RRLTSLCPPMRPVHRRGGADRMTGTRWCAVLAPATRQEKASWHAAGRARAAHDPKCGYGDLGGSTFLRRTGPKLSARLSRDNRRAGRKAVVVDTNRNPKADIFAEQLEADIFAELGQRHDLLVD